MVEHPNNHLPNQQNYPDDDNEEMEVEDEFDLNEMNDLDLDNSFPESEELASIDNQLDQLNSALDDMEQKNDNILAELTELLHENREIRKQLQEVRLENSENPDDEHKKPQPLREKNN